MLLPIKFTMWGVTTPYFGYELGNCFVAWTMANPSVTPLRIDLETNLESLEEIDSDEFEANLGAIISIAHLINTTDHAAERLLNVIELAGKKDWVFNQLNKVPDLKMITAKLAGEVESPVAEQSDITTGLVSASVEVVDQFWMNKIISRIEGIQQWKDYEQQDVHKFLEDYPAIADWTLVIGRIGVSLKDLSTMACGTYPEHVAEHLLSQHSIMENKSVKPLMSRVVMTAVVGHRREVLLWADLLELVAKLKDAMK